MENERIKRPAVDALFALPCACQNLRRLTRILTRIYDQELRKAGLEVTQFGVLTALSQTGETNQKRLSAGLAMDSTTLTRTLALIRKQGWVRVRRGEDRRERLVGLTPGGKAQVGGGGAQAGQEGQNGLPAIGGGHGKKKEKRRSRRVGK